MSEIGTVELVFLLLLLFIIVFGLVARKFRTPYPIVMVIGGRYTVRCGESGRSRLANSRVAGDLLMAPPGSASLEPQVGMRHCRFRLRLRTAGF